MSWEDILKQTADITGFLKDAKDAYEKYGNNMDIEHRLDLFALGEQKGVSEDAIIMVIQSLRTDNPILNIVALSEAIRAEKGD